MLNIDTYDLLSGLKPVSNVIVKFDMGIPPDAQGKALLSFEKNLRELTRMDVRVFKEKMVDDSKLRVKMTKEEREKL